MILWNLIKIELQFCKINFYVKFKIIVSYYYYLLADFYSAILEMHVTSESQFPVVKSNKSIGFSKTLMLSLA